MPALRSTCGCLSLQVGVVTFSAVMMTLSVIILNLTFFNYKPTNTTQIPIARIVVLIFIAFLLMVATLSFLGAYKENRNLIIVSFGLLVLLAVYWLTMCIFSMTDTILHMSNVCIQKRCAPSLWIVRFDYSEHDAYAKYNFPFPYTTVSTNKINGKTDLKNIKARRSNNDGYSEALPDYTEKKNNSLTAENDYDNVDRNTESPLIFKTTPAKSRNNPRTKKSNSRRKYTPPSKNRSNKYWMEDNFNNLYSFQNRQIVRRSPENETIETNVNKSANDSKKPVYNINTKILEPDRFIDEDDDYYDDKLDNYGWHLKSGWHLFGLIFLFFTNTIFFFFNAINLWSYADELFYKYVGYDNGEPEEHS